MVAHDYEDEIKCPYCDHVYHDSWEYNEDDDSEIECVACGKAFRLSVNYEVTYSTERIGCKNGHDFNEPKYHNISQETCDRWNKEKFTGKTDHAPHSFWVRSCKNCEKMEHANVPVGGACPWEAKPQEGGE